MLSLFAPVTLQPILGPFLLYIEVSQSHTIRRTVGLSGRVISPSQRPPPTQDNTTYKHKRQTSISSAELEPAIPATKRPKTYALDRAATEIGHVKITEIINISAKEVQDFYTKYAILNCDCYHQTLGLRFYSITIVETCTVA
jgi:hypothetical protein